MSIFEYIIASFTILLGLAFTRLLHALPYVFIKGKRDFIHSTLFLSTLFLLVQMWWIKWSFVEVKSWDFIKYFLLLLDFGVIFMLCDAVAPSNAESISSWNNFFHKVRNRWFYLLIFKFILTGFENWYMLPNTKPFNYIGALFICFLPFIAINSKNEKTLKIISILILIIFISIPIIWAFKASPLNEP